MRHGSGVYKFKGLPPGGTSVQKAHDSEGVAGQRETAAVAVNHEMKPEGGLYIGEWNAGFMQGLGILKYDDGER